MPRTKPTARRSTPKKLAVEPIAALRTRCAESSARIKLINFQKDRQFAHMEWMKQTRKQFGEFADSLFPVASSSLPENGGSTREYVDGCCKLYDARVTAAIKTYNELVHASLRMSEIHAANEKSLRDHPETQAERARASNKAHVDAILATSKTALPDAAGPVAM